MVAAEAAPVCRLHGQADRPADLQAGRLVVEPTGAAGVAGQVSQCEDLGSGRGRHQRHHHPQHIPAGAGLVKSLSKCTFAIALYRKDLAAVILS